MLTAALQPLCNGWPMERFTGVHHVALATRDMDQTIRFWRDLLGLRLVTTHGAPGYRHYFFALAEHAMIAFFEWPDVEPLAGKDHGVPVAGPFGFDHVALGVRDRDELWNIKDDLEAAGFWASEVVDHGYLLSLYTFDPNEIPVELTYELPDRDPRAKPIFADRDPGEVAREGSEPRREMWPEVRSPTSGSERRTYPGPGSELY